MVNSNRLLEKFSVNELMYGLSKIANQENIDSDIYLSLESKGLVYRVDYKELLTEKGEKTLKSLKKSLNNLWVKHGYNITNYEELLLITDDVQKAVRDIMNGSIEESEEFIDITLETPIYKLIFHENKKLNNSIIIGLHQDSHISTVKDLIEKDLEKFYRGNGKKSINVLEKVLEQLGKLGFIR